MNQFKCTFCKEIINTQEGLYQINHNKRRMVYVFCSPDCIRDSILSLDHGIEGNIDCWIQDEGDE